MALAFSFNDIIDPNGKYIDDIILSIGANVLGYSCSDYTISINRTYSFYVGGQIDCQE